MKGFDSSHGLVRFAGFCLDLGAGELHSDGGKTLRLPEQPFRILTMLLERPGEVLTREDIRKKLWPNDTIVEFEHSISAAMNRLRQTLGDSADRPQYIETLARRGYRWMVSVEWVESSPPASAAPGLPEEVSARSLIGQTVSHYRMIRKIGSGGMGVVYEAEDLKLGRHVALKFLPEELANDPQALERFRREARSASALNHPNICTVYEIDEAKGVHFIAIEFLHGETLKDRIAHGRFSPAEIVPILIQICRALEAAHAAGIIHRDIKPANVFLTHTGTVKVLDFGVAKQLGMELATLGGEGSLAETISVEKELTSGGATVGTVDYMSPEQTRRETVDGRSDLFSLGTVFYEMVTGKRPFSGSSVLELFTAIQQRSPEPVEDLAPGVPQEVGRIISKALEKDRDARYPRAEDLRVDVENLEARLEAGHRTVPRVMIAVLAIAMLAGIGTGLWRWKRGATVPAPIRSLAVLPLENLTGDPAQDYFVDGMTDALIANLAKVGSLRVISRTSAMHYKGSHKTLPEIAQELNVNAVIEGSVLRSGDRVRINAQLVDALTDHPIWTNQYDEDVKEVLQLQTNVAREVVQQIRVHITPEEQARVAGVSNCNSEAHDFYLQGMFQWFKATPEAYEKSRQDFLQAVDRDPTCAEGYFGLAYYYSIAADEGILPPGEAWAKARTAAQKAAALNTVGASPQVSLTIAAADLFYDWNWPEAEKGFKRVLEQIPSWSDAHREYSVYLRTMGKTEEAIAEARKARELDPFSVRMSNSLGWAYFYAHRWDEAIAQFKQTLEMDSQFLAAHEGLAKCYQQKGMQKEVFQEIEAEFRLAGDMDSADLLERTYQSVGYDAALRTLYLALLEQYKGDAKTKYVSPLVFANLYALLDEKDEAFAWLEKAYQERSSKLTDLKIDPDFDNLRGDPRFASLLKRIGLP